MAERGLLVLDLGCGFIPEELANLVEARGYYVERAELGFTHSLSLGRRLRFYIEFLAELRKERGFVGVVLCSPVYSRLILWLFFMLFLSYKRIVVLISPSTKHQREKLTFIYLALFSLLLSILRIRGRRILLVYTTPVEKQLFGHVALGDAEAFFPVYGFPHRRGAPEPIRENPPLIFVYGYDANNVKWIPGTLLFLKELGVRPLVVIGFEKPESRCLSDPVISCVYSSDYDMFIRRATIVVAVHASPEANMIVARAVSHGRPVIADRYIGMARFYHDTGLIEYEDYTGPENLATKILKILNSLDHYRQLSLRVVVAPPRKDYFLDVLDEFLSY